MEEPIHQGKPRRRIVSRRRDLRVSPGKRVAVSAHRRLEGDSSGGMTASSAYAEVLIEPMCGYPARPSRSLQLRCVANGGKLSLP